jgi:hypothetical protein
MSPLTVILAAVLVYILVTHRQPPLLVAVKEKYSALLAYLDSGANTDPRWDRLKKRAIVTGLIDHDKSKGAIAYNVNKGYEICICLAGDDINSAFYVLLHEIAHMSVTEYDHTTKFWNNFRDLKALCNSLGIYDNAAGSTKYCGDSVVRS